VNKNTTIQDQTMP